MEDETSAFAFVRIVLRAVKDADLPDPYTPYVYGSVPVFGSWNSAKAVPLQQVSLTSWEIECILPWMHDAFDLKFLFKHNGRFLSEDDSHKITKCKTSSCAKVSVPGRPPGSIEFQVAATTEKVSALALGTSWKAYKNGQSPRSPEYHSLEDISHYAVPAPSSGEKEYAADSAETPRDIQRSPVRFYESRPGSPRSLEQPQFVDSAVGSSPAVLARIGSDVSVLNGSLDGTVEDMPAASGAVAAGAVADQMLGPKERRRLAIVLVGLPARGKTFTAAKLTRYLRWLGHDTKHFNVGKYRRVKHGCTQNADFFRADNQEGVDARNEVASLAMEDMLAWMDEGGQVGVFDATNSTKLRRQMLLNMAEGRCQVIFLETICRDPAIIEHNIRLKIRKSPDYSDQPDYEAALSDFKARLVNYAKAYEPVDEGSYIKMIDKVSEQDGQMQVNNISGYLPGRIVFFLVNSNLTPRPILLTRHGESVFNLNGRIGGDPVLTEAGEEYALKLAGFINQRLKPPQTASIWTSTLRRTILTARHIVGFPTVQWRALDEIDAGVCDGMTYEEIRETMPDEYKARKLDKLRYRYPRGESYLDVIQRLEPVIVELERQRSPVVVVAHQAILRSLYAYFTDKPLNEIPHVEIPLHTIIEIQMGVAGVQEKRYKLIGRRPTMVRYVKLSSIFRLP